VFGAGTPVNGNHCATGHVCKPKDGTHEMFTGITTFGMATGAHCFTASSVKDNEERKISLT
jgi:hypothetical protein